MSEREIFSGYSTERGKIVLKTTSINTDIVGLQDVINKCADGLLVVDKNHVVQFINPAALSVLDKYSKEIIGKEFEHAVEEEQTVEIEVFQKSGKVQQFCQEQLLWQM